MPEATGRLNKAKTTPYVALIGNVKVTWSFSAFTVLIGYAITNLAAIVLPEEQRLYPRWIAWTGLIACLFLASGSSGISG